jgi:hypothetical protein
MQLEDFERPLNDDPIRHVFITHGFFGEKQAFESDRFYRAYSGLCLGKNAAITAGSAAWWCPRPDSNRHGFSANGF